MSQIAPSLLAADFLNLEHEAGRFADSGARILHLDVMDGQFVPNMTFGWPLVHALRPLLPGARFDAHLMVNKPLGMIVPFAAAGADMLTIHVECENDVDECIDAIVAQGMVPGLSIRPGTPPQAIFPWLSRIGLALVMTVEPGFGGQKLRWDCVEKIAPIRQEARRVGNDELLISVDGGINAGNCAAVAEAGADILVAGSAVFGQTDMAAAFARLNTAIN